MIKMIVFNKMKEGLTPEQYRDYYENVHAPLLRSLFPTLGVYRRNYVDRERTALTDRNAEAASTQAEFDSVTEAFFESWEAFEASATRTRTRDPRQDQRRRGELPADLRHPPFHRRPGRRLSLALSRSRSSRPVGGRLDRHRA